MSINGTTTFPTTTTTSTDYLAQAGSTSAGKLSSAEQKLNSAISSGDNQSIFNAQREYQKAERNFTMLSNLLEASHKIMMNIINKIGRQ